MELDISHTSVGNHHKRVEPSDAVPQTSEMKATKRPAASDSTNPSVFKRKAAPANLFITNKKPIVPSGDRNEINPGEKKESVRERLARQMVMLDFGDRLTLQRPPG